MKPLEEHRRSTAVAVHGSRRSGRFLRFKSAENYHKLVKSIQSRLAHLPIVVAYFSRVRFLNQTQEGQVGRARKGNILHGARVGFANHSSKRRSGSEGSGTNSNTAVAYAGRSWPVN